MHRHRPYGQGMCIFESTDYLAGNYGENTLLAIICIWHVTGLSVYLAASSGMAGQDDVIKWKHFSALLALCAGNSPVTCKFPS